MTLKRKAKSPGQDSAVYLHLKEEGDSFKDNVHPLDREDRWFERGDKVATSGNRREAIPEERRRSTYHPQTMLSFHSFP